MAVSIALVFDSLLKEMDRMRKANLCALCGRSNEDPCDHCKSINKKYAAEWAKHFGEK